VSSCDSWIALSDRLTRSTNHTKNTKHHAGLGHAPKKHQLHFENFSGFAVDVETGDSIWSADKQMRNCNRNSSLCYYVLIAILCFALELALTSTPPEIQPVALPPLVVSQTVNPCPLGQIYRVIDETLQCIEPPGSSSMHLHYLTLTSPQIIPTVPTRSGAHSH